MSTAADWVAGRHAAVDRLADRLAEQHGTLVVPANPKVVVGVNWLDQLTITVGTCTRGTRPHEATGRQLTAVISDIDGKVGLFDTTTTPTMANRVPLSTARLGHEMTAQQVLDRLCAEIGPDQCAECGEFGDHHAGTDERPWCAEHCPDCTDEEVA